MGFFDIFKKKKKMSDGLEKTRTDFFQNIVNTLTSSVIDDDLYNDLEEQLILAGRCRPQLRGAFGGRAAR